MQQRFVKAAGHELAVLDGNPEAGGPPVVFIHGFLCSVYFWPSVLPEEVRKTTRWYSLSLPAHHPSRMPADSGITPHSLAVIYASAIRQLTSGQPAALVGWSTGSFVALNLAAHHPELVQSVLSIAGFAKGRCHGLIGIAQRCASAGVLGRQFVHAMARLGHVGSLFRLASRAMTAGGQGVKRCRTTDVMHADYKRHRIADLLDFLAAIRDFDITDRLQQIEAPTAVVCGNRDSAIRFFHAQEMTREIPNARLVTLDNVGHLFFGEAKDQWEEVLLDWLDDLWPTYANAA